MKLLGLIALMTSLTVADSQGAPAPDRRVPYKSIGNLQLDLHVFLPNGHQASDQRPAVVFFFGGGWMMGTPTQFYSHARHFADRGLVVFVADYRVKNTHGTSPRESVMDAKSAMRWVRSHASEMGVDPARLIAAGASAGGHLAAATAMLRDFDDPSDDRSVSCRPEALVLFNPVIDNGPGGYGHDRVRAYWRAFSPIEHIGPDTPPTVFFLGTEDEEVPVATAERFKRAMEQHGRRCDLHLYPGQKHGFFNVSNRVYFEKTLMEMDRFLVSLGYLAPAR